MTTVEQCHSYGCTRPQEDESGICEHHRRASDRLIWQHSADDSERRVEVEVIHPGPRRTMTLDEFETLVEGSPGVTFDYRVREWDGLLASTWPRKVHYTG